LGIKNNQVQIGIDALGDLPVYREEIYLKIAEAELLNAVQAIES